MINILALGYDFSFQTICFFQIIAFVDYPEFGCNYINIHAFGCTLVLKPRRVN